MEIHNTSTINSSARYCLVKPGDKVRNHQNTPGRYTPICGLRGRYVCYYQSDGRLDPLWAVAAAELNAEFGANNPDPCELVRRTAAMYSKHEFPADTTKMFDAEHEATKEEVKA